MKYLKMLFIITMCLNTAMTAYAQDNITVFGTSNSFYAIRTDGCLYETIYREELHTDKNDLDYDYNYIKPKDMTGNKVTDDVISISDNFLLKEDGTVWEMRTDTDVPFYVMNDVKSISASSALLMIKNDSALWGVGNNTYGQLAQGTMKKSLKTQITENMQYKNLTKCTPENFEEPVKIMDDVKTALIIDYVSVVLKNDGTVWTFGYDQGSGMLGIGERWLTNNKPTQILSGIKEIFLSGKAAFALDYDNTLWRWGSNYIGYAGGDYTVKAPERYIENVKTATNMQGYNLVIKSDNSMWLYGDTSSDGGIISEKPLKLYDNVVSAIGLNEYTGEIDRVLVLTENRDLLLLTIPVKYGTTGLNFEKIMGNVKLPNDIPPQKQFTDISDKSDEVEQAVNSLAKSGIINGTSETEFSPDKPITRAEIAALLLRMTTKNIEDSNGDFIDVTPNKWYYDIAGTSKKYNIVVGFDDNTFRGDNEITKLQLISLSARTLTSEKDIVIDKESANYSDIPEWAQNDIAIAEQEGLINIKNELKDIDEPMTRGEAAIILYRLYEKI